jgi:hypothetical protein
MRGFGRRRARLRQSECRQEEYSLAQSRRADFWQALPGGRGPQGHCGRGPWGRGVSWPSSTGGSIGRCGCAGAWRWPTSGLFGRPSCFTRACGPVAQLGGPQPALHAAAGAPGGAGLAGAGGIPAARLAASAIGLPILPAGVQAGHLANIGGLLKPGAAAVAAAAGAGGGAGGVSPLDGLVSPAQLAIVSGAPEADVRRLFRQTRPHLRLHPRP